MVHDAVREHARTPFDETTWRRLAEGIRFVAGDLNDPASIKNALKGVYGVFAVLTPFE